jgi:hypothetical protein
MDIGESEVSALKPEGKAFMVKAQQVEYRGLQVVNVRLAFHDS